MYILTVRKTNIYSEFGIDPRTFHVPRED